MKRLLVALPWLILATAVVAQSTGVPYFPQVLPARTVVGRLATTPGPTEAIPFATLSTSLSSAVNFRVVTTASVTITSTDQIVAIKKASPSTTAIALPAVSTRGGLALKVFDWAGNAGDMTFTPSGSDKIMGVSSWIVGSGGVAGLGGALDLYPDTTLGGWVVK